jgi:hypothetical protein
MRFGVALLSTVQQNSIRKHLLPALLAVLSQCQQSCATLEALAKTQMPITSTSHDFRVQKCDMFWPCKVSDAALAVRKRKNKVTHYTKTHTDPPDQVVCHDRTPAL